MSPFQREHKLLAATKFVSRQNKLLRKTRDGNTLNIFIYDNSNSYTNDYHLQSINHDPDIRIIL